MRNMLIEMLDALTSAYSRVDYHNRQRDAPVETNIGKLFSVFAWGLDIVQEHAEKVKLWDILDNACGSVLDRYGANYGVKRFGENDRFYRLAIKLKLLSQLSGGDINTVLDAAASLLEVPIERIVLKELFPAKIGLDIQEADLSPETLEIIEDIMGLIKRILAAGVGLIPTLCSYREYRRKVVVRYTLFDQTSTVFGLPDARRALAHTAPMEYILFEHSKLKLQSETAPPLPKVSVGVRAAASVVFEHSHTILKPIY